MTQPILLAVKPRYSRAILDGRKTVEIRRRFPQVNQGTTILLYSSSPDCAVLGSASIKRYSKVGIDEVWRRYRYNISITKPDLEAYLSGVEQATILEIENPITWNNSVPLEAMRTELGIEAPQSFRYLSENQLFEAERLGMKRSGAPLP